MWVSDARMEGVKQKGEEIGLRHIKSIKKNIFSDDFISNDGSVRNVR